VKKPKHNQTEPTPSILNVAVPASFNPNLASIFARYWWNIIARATVNLLRGKKARTAVANEYANALPQYTKRKQRIEFMNNQLTPNERKHLAAVKSLPCGVCGSQGVNEAHHIEQHLQYTCIPLCADCHRGNFNGIHGQKRIWNVYKKTELSVLNETIKTLLKNK
jgi:hypothetical protein